MKKFILSLMMATALTACGDKKADETAQADTRPVVNLGASLALTGDMAETGQNLKSAMELALKDEEAQQNLKYNYKIHFEDDQYEIKKAVSNWNLFKSLDNVDVIFTFWGAIGKVGADFAEKNKIIHMGCALSQTQAKGLYNFNNASKVEEHATKTADFYKRRGVKNIALIAYQCKETDEFFTALREKLEERGINIVAELKPNPTDTDLTLAMLKVKEKNPDMLNVQLLPPQSAIFAKTKEKLNWDVPVSSLNVLLLSSDYFDGAYIFQDDTGTAEFAKHFVESTGQRVIGCSANFYDNVRLIIDAYEHVGDGKTLPTHEQIAQYILNNKNFNSSFGQYDIDADGHINTPSIVKQLDKGQLKEVSE